MADSEIFEGVILYSEQLDIMIQIERILFPTDFSPCANQALDHALYLANKYGATLHMLHAIVLHEDDPHSPAAHFSDTDEIHQRLRDLARIEMKTAVSERADARGKVVMQQRRGYSVADVVLAHVSPLSVGLGEKSAESQAAGGSERKNVVTDIGGLLLD